MADTYRRRRRVAAATLVLVLGGAVAVATGAVPGDSDGGATESPTGTKDLLEFLMGDGR